MDEAQIRILVKQLDTKDRSTEEAAWSQLRVLGDSVVPYLAEFYPIAKNSRGDGQSYSTPFHTRTSEAAFRLGVAALSDLASIVRYRACSVLAYSLRRDAIPHLDALIAHKDRKTADDA